MQNKIGLDQIIIHNKHPLYSILNINKNKLKIKKIEAGNGFAFAAVVNIMHFIILENTIAFC